MGVYDDVLEFVTNFFGDPSYNVGSFNYLGIDINITLDLTILRSAEASEKIEPPFLATNIALVMANLFENPDSTIFRGLVDNSPIENLELIFSIRPTTTASIGESEVFGDPTQGYARINIGWLDMEYLSGSSYERFNLQHIVNHEMVHVFTGLPDGQAHNDLTNDVNGQTDGGPPSLGYGYFREVDEDDAIFFHCFLAGTPITMWPIDPNLKPGPDGLYDQEKVRASLWTKPIEQVARKDLVLSYDHKGNMVPGFVPQTMTNFSKIILDFHGTWVTPGHVYWCVDGKYANQYAPLIDILRTDGAVEHQSGAKIRASTGCEVGSLEDELVTMAPLVNGQPDAKQARKIRLGTRMIRHDVTEVTVMDGVVGALGPIDKNRRFPNGQHVSEVKMAFHQEGTMPNPEDYVLIRSQTTLEEIYQANQWEAMRPQMPAQWLWMVAQYSL